MRTYLSSKQVRKKLGDISRTQFWRLRKHPDYKHRKFPEGVELSPGIIVWEDNEIDRWLAATKNSQHQNLLDLAISVLQARKAIVVGEKII